MATVPVVVAKQLAIAFGARAILDNASFSIEPGERVGLVGGNGAGKSTLAKVLTNTIELDSGNIVLPRNATIAYLAQEASFPKDHTARQYLTAGLIELNLAKEKHQKATQALEASSSQRSSVETDRLLAQQSEAAHEIEMLGGWDQDHRIAQISEKLGLAQLDQLLDTMSGGERRRVALARILLSPPDLAVLDEPTNHLDIDTIEWLETFLTEHYRGALLLITHDRYILDQVVDRTFELDNGQIYNYAGGWSEYLRAKAERLAVEKQTEANRQNILRRELDWLSRSPKARTTKSKSRIQRANELVDNAPKRNPAEMETLEYRAEKSGKTILELTDVGLTIGEKHLIDAFTLSLREGERVGIIGKNGTGKTSLLKLILGKLKPTTGRVCPGFNTTFAYFDQERKGLVDHHSIADNVAENCEKVTFAGKQVDVRGYLRRFLFSYDKQKQPVSSLSGGERARVALAKFLLEPANVLILDEPTNDLDVSTLSSLEEILIESGATILFVTHDRYFLDRVATSVLAFEDNAKVIQYQGSYQALRHLREAKLEASKDAAIAASKASREPSPKASSEKPPGKGLTFTEKHELGKIMPKIEAAEKAFEQKEAALADPELYASRGSEVPALVAEKEAAEQKLNALIKRWEELEEKKSQQ